MSCHFHFKSTEMAYSVKFMKMALLFKPILTSLCVNVSVLYSFGSFLQGFHA